MSCNFNLRSRTATKPTIIYMVVYVGGKQYKISTGIKLLPSQWDFKRQTPKVCGMFSEEANRQSTRSLRIINNYSFCFQKYFGYLCSSNLDFEITELQTYLMSEKSNTTMQIHKLSKRPLKQKATVATKMPSEDCQESKCTSKATILVEDALKEHLKGDGRAESGSVGKRWGLFC